MKTCSRLCAVIIAATCVAFITRLYGSYYQFNLMFFDQELPQKSRKGLVQPLAYVEPERITSALDIEKSVCSLRQAVSMDRNFQSRFNFSVPVLMWAGHHNDSAFQQLQSCALPYGLKNVPSRVISEALTFLKEPSSSLLFDRGTLPCVRCAVVGNGGILKGSKQGKAIDSHHFVFRVNGAVTKGFEQDVGTKTSFYGFTTNSMKNSLLAYRAAGFDKIPQGQNIQYVFIPAEVRDFLMLIAAIKGVPVTSGEDANELPSMYFGTRHNVNQFKILHTGFIKYVTERFLKSPQMQMFPDLYMPSTGALMLMVALHTCDQVSAYGFITENYWHFSDHYFDAVKQPLIFYANHDLKMEAALWAKLHAKNILWLYRR